MDYVAHILVLMGIYVLLASSLNLLVGSTGILSVAHAGFFGVGAYAYALVATSASGSLPLSMGSSVVAAGACGAIVGFPSTRLRGDYFVVATFAFQVIAVGLFSNLVSVTGGPLGLAGIPRPSVFGIVIADRWGLLAIICVTCAAGLWVVRRIGASPYGRVLRAIRDSESMALCAGKNTARAKVTVFIISAGIAGGAGGLYAFYVTFIDPSSFSIMESVLILTMVIIGGADSFYGPIAGAIALIALPEMLRFIGVPTATAAHVKQILYGTILIAAMLWRPRGLAGQYGFEGPPTKQ